LPAAPAWPVLVLLNMAGFMVILDGRDLDRRARYYEREVRHCCCCRAGVFRGRPDGPRRGCPPAPVLPG